MLLAGGIMQHGYQCGILWGSTLAAGAQAFRLHGSGPRAEAAAIVAAQRIVQSFRARYKHIDCLELTDVDWRSTMQGVKYFVKGGPIRCFRMAAKYAPVAFDEINTGLSDGPVTTPSSSVSCASMVARKLGEPDLHTVMASGLAGGIGLSGGACGALGAAVWIIGMNDQSDGSGKAAFKSPKATETIEKFLKCTDYEFECAKIVGRTFANVEEHADHVCKGGCSKIIEALAAG